jgi:hypothetical protein
MIPFDIFLTLLLSAPCWNPLPQSLVFLNHLYFC